MKGGTACYPAPSAQNQLVAHAFWDLAILPSHYDFAEEKFVPLPIGSSEIGTSS